MRAGLLSVLLGCGCNAVLGGLLAATEGPPSSEGHIVGSGYEASFVRRPEAIFALWKGRLTKLQSDGSSKEDLLDHVELAAVSPAGDAIATFGDSGIVVVDTKRGLLRRLAPHDGSCAAVSIRWGESGRSFSVELRAFHRRPSLTLTTCEKEGSFFMDAATGNPTAPEPAGDFRSASSMCVPPLRLERGACGGLDLVESGGQRRPLIRIEGCSVSHHYGPPIGVQDELVADDCRALAFGFDGSIFIADLATGHVSHLAFGRLLR